MPKFSEAFPELATRPNEAMTSAADRQRDRSFRSAVARAQKQGWEIVTIVNLHPFALDMNLGYLGHISVPKKKDGELYSKLVIDAPRFDAKDLGDAKFEYVMVTPKELADDFCRYYRSIGGVFVFNGVGQVPPAMLEEAIEAQQNWYMKMYAEGNANWAQYQKNPRYISQRMRDAAKELYRLRLIAVLPEWTVVSKNDSPDMSCEGCGVMIAKSAKFCPTCHTIYDPEWVKAKRPDLWKAQNPTDSVATATAKQAAGASTADIDLDKLIQEEEGQ